MNLYVSRDIFGDRQSKIQFCDLKQVYVRVNEQQVKVNEPMQVGMMEFEDNYVDRWQYDVVLTKVKYQTEKCVLDRIKELKLADIDEYDSSKHVNSFKFQGVDMWLDKETRNGLVMRLNAEKAVGATETTLWLGTQPFSLTVDEGIAILSALELYASKCFDNTASHKAAVEAMDDVEDIINYDYKVGYPEKLSFE